MCLMCAKVFLNVNVTCLKCFFLSNIVKVSSVLTKTLTGTNYAQYAVCPKKLALVCY